VGQDGIGIPILDLKVPDRGSRVGLPDAAERRERQNQNSFHG